MQIKNVNIKAFTFSANEINKMTGWKVTFSNEEETLYYSKDGLTNKIADFSHSQLEEINNKIKEQLISVIEGNVDFKVQEGELFINIEDGQCFFILSSQVTEITEEKLYFPS